jgi:hypothetical protein
MTRAINDLELLAQIRQRLDDFHQAATARQVGYDATIRAAMLNNIQLLAWRLQASRELLEAGAKLD